LMTLIVATKWNNIQLHSAFQFWMSRPSIVLQSLLDGRTMLSVAQPRTLQGIQPRLWRAVPNMAAQNAKVD
jgi:hypothetical protein